MIAIKKGTVAQVSTLLDKGAEVNVVNSVKHGEKEAPETGSPHAIALQLHSDIKAYSDILRSLGLSDHFIALNIGAFVFVLLALSRLLWLCFTGACSPLISAL